MTTCDDVMMVQLMREMDDAMFKEAALLAKRKVRTMQACIQALQANPPLSLPVRVRCNS